MALTIGLVGLPNAGKSTLLNALARVNAPAASYPFTTIEPNTGVAVVPDERLDRLTELIKPERKVPATVEFVDIAGLVQGASKGEGLGNQFLGYIRNVDAIAIVLRAFESGDVTHPLSTVDPERDAEVLWVELGLADLAAVQRRLESIRTAARSGDKAAQQELAALTEIERALDSPAELRRLLADNAIAEVADRLRLLTAKPAMSVLNIGEDNEHQRQLVARVRNKATTENMQVCVINAQLEDELNQLEPAEAAEYREALGAEQDALTVFIHTAYKLLGLITFFTIDGPEVRAWTVRQGATAPQAAGKIHSDFERGFIRAEVIGWQALLEAGSIARARELGQLRLEGKEYLVEDGDVIHFRFAV